MVAEFCTTMVRRTRLQTILSNVDEAEAAIESGRCVSNDLRVEDEAAKKGVSEKVGRCNLNTQGHPTPRFPDQPEVVHLTAAMVALSFPSNHTLFGPNTTATKR
jgi:hypothetical protein